MAETPIVDGANTALDAPGLRLNVDVAQVDLERPEDGTEAKKQGGGEGAEARAGENLVISITAEE